MPSPPAPSGTVSAGQPSSIIWLQSAVGRRALLDDFAHEADGALAAEHGADAVAQLVLLGCELQVHGDRALSET